MAVASSLHPSSHPRGDPSRHGCRRTPARRAPDLEDRRVDSFMNPTRHETS
jgi:hypothetical protein